MGADTTFGETNFNPDKPTKKVQWSDYGELGNISQKPPSPSSATAEEILQKYMDMSMIICPLHVVPRTVALDAMHEFAALQNKPQPTAEGAEEILKNRLGEQFGLLTPFGLEILIAAMTDFATLHAQRLAEKMVEEKLKEELIAYDKWVGEKYIDNYRHETAPAIVDEYLKSRER